MKNKNSDIEINNKDHEVRGQQNHFYLKNDQWEKVCNTLDKKAIVNKKLKALFKRESIFCPPH